MKIEYENLITDANRRKESLKRLEDVLADVPHMTVMAQHLQTFALKYKNALENLDAEAKKLIPRELEAAMGNSLIYLMDSVYNTTYFDHRLGQEVQRGLLQLNDYLADQE